MWRWALAAGLWLAASPAFGDDDAVTAALVEVGRLQNGQAMLDYIRRDPVPIRFAKLPPRLGGWYKYTQGPLGVSAVIELSDRMRGDPWSAGRVLYHEYIHRLAHMGGAPQTDEHRGHSVEAYETAMRRLRASVRPGGPPLEAPSDVKVGFLMEGGVYKSPRDWRPPPMQPRLDIWKVDFGAGR